MTMTQTVDIPENRRLVIEVPHEVTVGKAQVEFKIISFDRKEENVTTQEKYIPPLKCLVGVDTSLVDSLVGIISNPENKTYDELRFEGMMDKYGEYFK